MTIVFLLCPGLIYKGNVCRGSWEGCVFYACLPESLPGIIRKEKQLIQEK
jgi:hypothetical protein